MAFVVTAVATAVELGTFAAIATAVSEVGLALTVVGAVTGNKDLMKIGGVLGLAGGVGSLAASFASGATGAAVEGAATAGATDAAAGTVANEAATAVDYMNGADLASDAVSSASSATSGAAAASAPSLAPSLAAPETSLAPTTAAADTSLQPTMASASPSTASAPSGSVLGAQGPTGPTGAQAPVTPADMDIGGRLGPDNIDVGGGFNPAGTGSSTSSLFDQFSGWVKANPKLAELGMQVVGGTFKGMSDYSLQQQKLAQNQQLINLQSYGNQVGTWSPTQPSTPGLINGVRQ